MLRYLLIFGAKDAFRRRFRAILTVLAISIGIMMVVAMISIVDGLESSFLDLTSKISGLIVQKKGAIDPTLGSIIDEDYADRISRIPLVEKAMPEIWYLPKKVEGERNSGANPRVLIGVDPELEFGGGTRGLWKIVSGRGLRSTDGYACVIGSEIADKLGKNVGDYISVEGRKLRIVGIFRIGSVYLDNYIVAPLDVAREIAGITEGKVSLIYVLLEDPTQSDKVKRIIEDMFSDLEVFTSSDYSKQTESMMAGVRAAAWAISGVSVVVGSLIIMNTMLMSVIEKVREFGIMRAVGWTRANIFELVLIQTYQLVAIGMTVGFVLGVAVSRILGNYMGIEVAITRDLVLDLIVLFFALGAGGGLYPAIKATRVDPVEAMR